MSECGCRGGEWEWECGYGGGGVESECGGCGGVYACPHTCLCVGGCWKIRRCKTILFLGIVIGSKYFLPLPLPSML